MGTSSTNKAERATSTRAPEQVQDYVVASIRGFLHDNPDSEFQRGYLAALVCVAREAHGLSGAEFDQADALCKANFLFHREELEDAHQALDNVGIPRFDFAGTRYTIMGRFCALLDESTQSFRVILGARKAPGQRPSTEGDQHSQARSKSHLSQANGEKA